MPKYLKIPLPAESETTPFFRQRTTLDSQSYRFDFRWCHRTLVWYYALYDAADQSVHGERPAVVWYDLLQNITAVNAPQGELYLLTADRLDPGLAELGDAVMIYVEPDEVEL